MPRERYQVRAALKSGQSTFRPLSGRRRGGGEKVCRISMRGGEIASCQAPLDGCRAENCSASSRKTGMAQKRVVMYLQGVAIGHQGLGCGKKPFGNFSGAQKLSSTNPDKSSGRRWRSRRALRGAREPLRFHTFQLEARGLLHFAGWWWVVNKPLGTLFLLQGRDETALRQPASQFPDRARAAS